MRDLIDLVEEANVLGNLSGYTVAVTLAHRDLPRDFSLSWLARYYQSFEDSGVKHWEAAFIEAIQPKVDEAIEVLGAWVANPTPLMRGLREAPKANHPLGIHWTDKRITAQDYGNGKFLLTANVRPDQIDWAYTLTRRIAWPKENEFSLKPGARLQGTIEGGNSSKPLGTFEGTV